MSDIEKLVKTVMPENTELKHGGPLMKPLSGNAFPHVRMRRTRRTPALRDMVRETIVTPHDLILPLFIEEDIDERAPVSSMPGVFRETEESLTAIMKGAQQAGIKAVMLFGVSHNKDHTGSDSYSPSGLLARMIDRAKQAAPDVTVISDACFCEFTDHGHCGPLTKDGRDVDNDRTLELIAMQAITACEAGADMIAPSGMMDGQVSAIRHGLDLTGFSHIPIMAYAAKFASCFYGPFRDAAGCALGHMHDVPKNRKSYQMDPANIREALREAAADEQEGADMLMVKPGMAYLDVLTKLRQQSDLPLAAYQVSGEYAMMQFAAQAGALDFREAMSESLLAFKRAGADLVLTYSAIDAARWFSE